MSLAALRRGVVGGTVAENDAGLGLTRETAIMRVRSAGADPARSDAHLTAGRATSTRGTVPSLPVSTPLPRHHRDESRCAAYAESVALTSQAVRYCA